MTSRWTGRDWRSGGVFSDIKEWELITAQRTTRTMVGRQNPGRSQDDWDGGRGINCEKKEEIETNGCCGAGPRQSLNISQKKK